MLVGLALFGFGVWRSGTDATRTVRNAIWIGPWLGGQVLIGAIGRYGGGRNILPNWVDILVVIGFSLAIFYWAIGSSLNDEQSAVAIAKDARQLNY
jgi:hypothetical protein